MERLARFIEAHPRLLAITGAGCSAPSGIPTYRNAEGEWQRSTPIQHHDFLTSELSRKRYWARSFAGWPAVERAEPNRAHRALAALEHAGHLAGLVTQNVDGLHQKAGHRAVTELHGRLDTVICLDCGALSSRAGMQSELKRLNPFLTTDADALTPDGDAVVPEDNIAAIRVPACSRCDGTLKPHVVFYGGAVDKALVSSVYDALAQADGLLVIGSSLMVFSAFRFARRAAETGKPIAIVNRGVTRADALAQLKIDVDCETALHDVTLSP